MLNALDFAIMGMFLLVIALGFFNGVSKVTAAIVAIYFGSIVAAAFYQPATNTARRHVEAMGESSGNLFFFVVLFFVFSSAFAILISNWLSGIKLPRRIEIVDNIGGAALGVIVSGLAVTLASMLLVILLQALNQTFGSGDMVGIVDNQIDGSTLVPVFLRIAPHFLRLISPWFPSGLPPILAGGAQG